MTETEECPACGARGPEARETNEGVELYCSWCSYRFDPPEDRHAYQTRAALRNKPKKPRFTVNWDK
jgi:hypothetical protein